MVFTFHSAVIFENMISASYSTADINNLHESDINFRKFRKNFRKTGLYRLRGQLRTQINSSLISNNLLYCIPFIRSSGMSLHTDSCLAPLRSKTQHFAKDRTRSTVWLTSCRLIRGHTTAPPTYLRRNMKLPSRVSTKGPLEILCFSFHTVS